MTARRFGLKLGSLMFQLSVTSLFPKQGHIAHGAMTTFLSYNVKSWRNSCDPHRQVQQQDPITSY